MVFDDTELARCMLLLAKWGLKIPPCMGKEDLDGNGRFNAVVNSAYNAGLGEECMNKYGQPW